MDDQDLETRLQRYRPEGPPPALRARVIAAGSSREPGRAAPVTGWLPAAAALAAMMLFYWLAANERQRLFVQLSPVSVERSIDFDGAVRP